MQISVLIGTFAIQKSDRSPSSYDAHKSVLRSGIPSVSNTTLAAVRENHSQIIKEVICK